MAFNLAASSVLVVSHIEFSTAIIPILSAKNKVETGIFSFI
jgi:hypothetical protein